jgi:hypothetical protein
VLYLLFVVCEGEIESIGDVKLDGVLSGKISGGIDKTTLAFEFELNLPSKEAAAGMSCGN